MQGTVLQDSIEWCPNCMNNEGDLIKDFYIPSDLNLFQEGSFSGKIK